MKRRITALLLALAMCIALAACGGGADTAPAEQSAASAASSAPAASPEPESEIEDAASSAAEGTQGEADQSATAYTTVYNQNVMEQAVMNGTGTERIGTRGIISIPESELTDETLTQICNDLEGLEYNWFTVELLDSDGKGLFFPGCISIAGMYGVLNEDGSIDVAEQYVTITDDGFTLEPATE